jgi:hypothetical protein
MSVEMNEKGVPGELISQKEARQRMAKWLK